MRVPARILLTGLLLVPSCGFFSREAGPSAEKKPGEAQQVPEETVRHTPEYPRIAEASPSSEGTADVRADSGAGTPAKRSKGLADREVTKEQASLTPGEAVRPEVGVRTVPTGRSRALPDSGDTPETDVQWRGGTEEQDRETAAQAPRYRPLPKEPATETVWSEEKPVPPAGASTREAKADRPIQSTGLDDSPVVSTDWEPAGEEDMVPEDPVVDLPDRPQPEVVVPPGPPDWKHSSEPAPVSPIEGTQSDLPAPENRRVVIPAGAILEVRLAERLSTRIHQTGDDFRSILDRDLRLEDGTVVPKGSVLRGEIVEAKEPGKVKGRALLRIRLVSLEYRGAEVGLQTKEIAVEASGGKGKDLAKVGVSTAIGAALGGLFGGKRGAAVGGATGAGSGTAGVLLSKGEDLELERERLFSFQLEDEVELRPPTR